VDVARREQLSAQLGILQWAADGCPDRAWPDESHKLSARALEGRGLVRVRRVNKRWHAEVTSDGRHYLEHGHYPEAPPVPVPVPLPSMRSSQAREASGGSASGQVRATFRQAWC
jgi:hypothetical protein